MKNDSVEENEIELNFNKRKLFKKTIEGDIIEATNNFTKILSTNEIKEKYTELYWGGNGVGDRFADKKFNYTVIYSGRKTKLYSENEDDIIPNNLLNEFMSNNIGNGIIGIYIHSKKINKVNRPIKKDICNKIKRKNCVICGSTSDIICDQKNEFIS